jgi:hypothetical protein
MKRELVPRLLADTGMLIGTGMLVGTSVTLPGQLVSKCLVASGALREERQDATDGADLNGLHLNSLHLNWRYSSP